MKPFLRITLFACLALVPPDGFAALPVVDAGSITTQLATAKRELLQQILMEANQKAIIANTVSQVKKLQTYIDLLGDPSKVDIDTLRGLYELLRELPYSQSAHELEIMLRDEYLFIDQPVYGAVSRDIVVDGKVVASRSTDEFKPEMAARGTIAYYQKFRDEALVRRAQVDKSIEAALRDLEHASTAAEVAKLQAVLGTLNAQRSEITHEIELAALEASTRHLANEVEADIRRKARAQEQAEIFKEGMRRSNETLPFLFGPVMFDR